MHGRGGTLLDRVAPVGAVRRHALAMRRRLEGVLAELGARGDGVLIGVHPGARFSDRRWPAERFAAVADRLAERLGAWVVLTGSEEDASSTAAVAQALRYPPVDLTGRLSLGGMGALLTRLAIFLTNDTGPAHLAYALRVPSVTVFGAASPDEWGPLDRGRHRLVEAPNPCRPCVGAGCIGRVEVESVLVQAKALLDRTGRTRA